MNIIEHIDRPCEYVEVAQTALIACQYLYLWLFAGPDDAYKVYSLKGFEESYIDGLLLG